MNLLIIGAGNMGLTYGHSFVNSGVVRREQLYFLEKTESKALEVREVSHNRVFTEPGAYLAEMDLIILAVKPQVLESVVRDPAAGPGRFHRGGV